jgi:predicted metal-binding membrane protein
MEHMATAGGAAMATMWTRSPGQTWPGAAASFLGMWVAMTIAMMLPVVTPALWRYRRALRRSGETGAIGATVLAAAAYLIVWTVLGMAIYPVGVALSMTVTREPSLAHVSALACGVVVTVAGAWQLSSWKRHRLASCRRGGECGHVRGGDLRSAWRHGLRLGVHCVRCCANLTAILLVAGVMDVRTMAAVGAIVAAERLTPAGARVARIAGVGIVAAGLVLVARAAGAG